MSGNARSSEYGTSIDFTDHLGRGNANMSNRIHCAQHTISAGFDPNTR